jgi:hypothetical protein
MKRKSGSTQKGKPARAKPRAKKRATKIAKAKPSHVPAAPNAMDALVTASAQALKLPLDPAWRGGVKFNLQLILRLATLVDEFPLPDDAEPGPVFYA